MNGLYPRAKQALDHLSRLIDHPRGTRMPSVAAYGDSGMGKTMIMERFRDDNPPGFNPGTGRERTPVLAMEMVGKPGERRFYAELLALLGAPQSPRADIVQMEQRRCGRRSRAATGTTYDGLTRASHSNYRPSTFSSVTTTNRFRSATPKAVDMATSAASRPRPITMRPMRGWL